MDSDQEPLMAGSDDDQTFPAERKNKYIATNYRWLLVAHSALLLLNIVFFFLHAGAKSETGFFEMQRYCKFATTARICPSRTYELKCSTREGCN
jgi:hypothetical protein